MNETERTPDEKKFLSTLGLCRKAGKVILGANLICGAIPVLHDLTVFVAADAAPNTRKRLADKCRFYGARLVEIKTAGPELAKALGKSGPLAAVAVTDKKLALAAEKYL